MSSMKITLNVWRQASPAEAGRMVKYELDNVSEHMSYLEMLYVLNEQLIC
ncbi:MAG: succinate dehydrogenase/fumarate reductase iron-sulfur subunit, partial [Acidobacteriota bacterium]